MLAQVNMWRGGGCLSGQRATCRRANGTTAEYTMHHDRKQAEVFLNLKNCSCAATRKSWDVSLLLATSLPESFFAERKKNTHLWRPLLTRCGVFVRLQVTLACIKTCGKLLIASTGDAGGSGSRFSEAPAETDWEAFM